MLATLLLAATAIAEPTFLTSVRDAYPSLSPDGKTLLFQSNRNGRWALYTANADGANVRVLLDSADDPSTPAWSPDGKRIVYVATVAGSTEIFVVDADGREPRQLTSAPGDDEHPHWGADGRIYWDSGRTTPDLSRPWNEHFQEVYSMAADGSDVRQHTQCRALCTFATPSPDGRRLAYRRVLPTPGLRWDQSAMPANSEIMVADRDGANERNVSQHAAFDGWPTWSPDGQWIAFASNRDAAPNVGQVYAVRPDGSGLHALTGGDWANVQPSFAPDGKRLLTYRHIETAQFEHGFVAVTDVAPVTIAQEAGSGDLRLVLTWPDAAPPAACFLRPDATVVVARAGDPAPAGEGTLAGITPTGVEARSVQHLEAGMWVEQRHAWTLTGVVPAQAPADCLRALAPAL